MRFNDFLRACAEQCVNATPPAPASERPTTMQRFTTYGHVRGQGPVRTTQDEAFRDLALDRHGCVMQGGYSDRDVVRITDTGRLETLTGEPVWPSHGRSTGAVRAEGI